MSLIKGYSRESVGLIKIPGFIVNETRFNERRVVNFAALGVNVVSRLVNLFSQ